MDGQYPFLEIGEDGQAPLQLEEGVYPSLQLRPGLVLFILDWRGWTSPTSNQVGCLSFTRIDGGLVPFTADLGGWASSVE